MANDRRPGVPVRISPTLVSNEWERAIRLRRARGLGDLGAEFKVWFPSELLVAGSSRKSPWARATDSKSRAARLYLSLIALSQVLAGPGAPARFRFDDENDVGDDADDGTIDCLARFRIVVDGDGANGGRISMSALLGRHENKTGARKNFSNMFEKLSAVGLMEPQGVLRDQRIRLLGPDGRPLATREVRATPARGYNKPDRVPLPLGLFRNGWIASLENKPLHTLLVLMLQRERAPLNEWVFAGQPQRAEAGIRVEAYKDGHNGLTALGILTPRDVERYRLRKGRGRANDRPHDFMINDEIFDRLAPTSDR